MLDDFKAGRLRALTNANVLTTGFDYPDIYLIAMLRPTMSASLYVQMAGRGMRVKSHIDHCLVLDFAGVVQTHGPVTAIEPSRKKGDGKGEAPVKVCDTCNELVHISAKVCPTCGSPFPAPETAKLELHHDDIMGIEVQEMKVTEWRWRKHTSRASGKEMLAVAYYGGLSDPLVEEYFPITHGGYAGDKAIGTLRGILTHRGSGRQVEAGSTLDDWAGWLNKCNIPKTIDYRRDGRFYRVLRRTWA
jgi:DNA repair protein RadD